MNELTHVDLFSGIGGFKLAAERAGFRTLGFSEVEPYACRVLAERWPDVPNIGDVRTTANFARFRGATLVSAGYPCQPGRLAGERKGTADHRWLWPAARDVIALVRPAWFLGENVLGHVSLGLDGVLFDLESLGYSAQPFIIPACAVDTKHRRDRVWIVAYAGSTGRQERDATAIAGDAGHATRSDAPQWGYWLPEPGMGRVANGIPNRAHRLKGLGNAIVPQVAERFTRWIAQIERTS